MSTSDSNKGHGGGPGSRFVSVPTEALVGFLQERGFQQTVTGNETSMLRTVKPGVQLKVLTSAAVGSTVARGLGEDAIRVFVILNGGRKRGGKDVATNKDGWALDAKGKVAYHVWADTRLESARVYRTGTVEDVLKRMSERLTEALIAVENKYGDERCPHCNAATYRNRECVSRECRNRTSQQVHGVNRAANGQEFNDRTLSDRKAQGLPLTTSNDPATDRQKKFICDLCTELGKRVPEDLGDMSKGQAALLIKGYVLEKRGTEEKTGHLLATQAQRDLLTSLHNDLDRRLPSNFNELTRLEAAELSRQLIEEVKANKEANKELRVVITREPRAKKKRAKKPAKVKKQ